MTASATTTGLVRPRYTPPGQAYVNTDKLELDLENAEWQAEALRLRLGTVKSERDQALKQVAARDKTIAQLRGTVAELNKALAAAKAERPARGRAQIKPIGRLSLNLDIREIQFSDRVVPLSRSEAEVMAQLFERPDVLITTPELADGMLAQLSLNSIRSFIWRVMAKLEAAGARGYLNSRNHKGAGGYWLTDPEQGECIAAKRLHRRKPGGPHPFAQPTIADFDPAQFRTDRLAAGLTMTALAAAAGVSRRTIGDWEHGRQIPSQHLYPCVLAVLRGPRE